MADIRAVVHRGRGKVSVERSYHHGMVLRPGPAHVVTAALWRRLVAEFTETAMLVAVIVGSGIAAARLSPSDVGLQLLQVSLASAFGLAVLILIFGPVSGGHFNPAVTVVDWFLVRRRGTAMPASDVLAYVLAQTTGAIAGAILADGMFDTALVRWSTQDRSDGHLLVGEVVATAGLVLLIFSLARSGRANMSAPAVGAYIGAAIWFTSSTGFANPAVTIGRAFTDTFAGIQPSSVPGFVAAQGVGALVAVGLLLALYPDAGIGAEQAVLPHNATAAPAGGPVVSADHGGPHPLRNSPSKTTGNHVSADEVVP